VPARSFEVVVEPPEEDLVGCQPEQVVDRLAVLAEAVQLGVDLDIDVVQETPADDLPDETEDEMLATLCNVRGTDVDYGTPNSFCRCDNDVVVFGDLEVVERLL
jgi:hypothetical protein